MTPTTILSRFARARAKTLTKEQVIKEIEYCERLAHKWLVLPDGGMQASKYLDAVRYYKKILETKYA